MKSPMLRRFILAGCAFILAGSTAWARPPVPYKHQGTAASVDRGARMIVPTEPARHRFRLGKIVKPTTFAWTDSTHFIKNGQPADAGALASGAQVRLQYWYPPKKKPPCLVKVVLETGAN